MNSHPAVISTASCHLTLPSPSPTSNLAFLTCASRLNWRRDTVAAALEAKRSRARKTTEKEIISPVPAADPHGFLFQVLDTISACRQARDKGARNGGCASEEKVFLTCQKCLPDCSVKQPTSAFPDERPIRLHS